jgi:hypothetical protein
LQPQKKDSFSNNRWIFLVAQDTTDNKDGEFQKTFLLPKKEAELVINTIKVNPGRRINIAIYPAKKSELEIIS